jgi:O-antigen ligase
MVAFLVQIILLGVLIGRQQNRRTALTAGLVVTVVACLMLWVGGEALVSRVVSIHTEARTELDGGLRLTIDRDGMKMFARHPILGWGLGTFATVYPQFRTFFTDKFVNEAHDDYLQLLVETGIIGFGIMMWFVVLVYRHAWRKLGDWTLDYNGAVSLAALLGCTGILVHSFVDFNLQIPANALLFYTLCAIAAAPTNFMVPRRVRRKHRTLEFQSVDASEPSESPST